MAFGKPVSMSSIYAEADGSYAVNGQKNRSLEIWVLRPYFDGKQSLAANRS